MSRLQFAALARDDLLDIARFIARDNPKRARSFVAELREQCLLLAQNPGMGVAKPEYADGLRMFPHGRYLIFFSTISQGVLIERVLHSARHLAAQFDNPTDSNLG
jgi:toxin ParE1/3/4